MFQVRLVSHTLLGHTKKIMAQVLKSYWT